MCAPAALLVSKVMVPKPAYPGQTVAYVKVPVQSHNVVDAAARGASDGLQLALNVGAMLIAFIGLVYLADFVVKGATGMTFVAIMSWFFRPFAFCWACRFTTFPL